MGSSQGDTTSWKRQIKYSVGLQQGIILNLPGKAQKNNSIDPILTGSYYLGLVGNADYKRWKTSLALTRYGYNAGAFVWDGELYANREGGCSYGHEKNWAGQITVYWQYAIKVGYQLKTKKKNWKKP